MQVLVVLSGFSLGAVGVFAATSGRSLVVPRPELLDFVDLKDGFLHVRDRFEGRVDLLDRARRVAMGHTMKKWGVPQANKAPLAVGCVARRTDGGRFSYCVVLKGDVEGEKLLSRIVAVHQKHLTGRGYAALISTVDVGGHPATVLGYMERDLVNVLVPMDGFMLMGSAPTDDLSLFRETVAVLDGDGPTPADVPEPVEVEVSVVPTGDESGRMSKAGQKKGDDRLDRLRNRFLKLHEKLRPEGAQEEDLKSLDERVNEQFLRASHYDLKLVYEPGTSAADDAYTNTYVLNYEDPEGASKMRELLLDEVLFFKENATSEGFLNSLDGVRIDARGNQVTISVQTFDEAGRYDAAFSLLASFLTLKGSGSVLGLEGAE